jgi:hypothetical protein
MRIAGQLGVEKGVGWISANVSWSHACCYRTSSTFSPRWRPYFGCKPHTGVEDSAQNWTRPL